MNSGIALGRVFGTEIRIHWSWIPVLAVMSVFFGVGLDSQAGARWSTGLAWGTAIATAVLILGSVVAHELAHVLVARRNGLGRDVLVVQLLGGTYVMETRPLTPGQQFRTAVAGPVLSSVLVVLFGAVAVVATVGYGSSDTGPVSLEAIDFAALTLSLFNVFLVVVNLIPGYPMDGGQLVHALAWRRGGDDRKANGTVSRIGRFAGYALLSVGAATAALVDFLPGMGLLVAGWLLLSSSRVLERRAFVQSLMDGLRVADAADSQPAQVPPQLTLDVFASQYMGERFGGVALVERGDELVGLIGQAQIRRVPKRNWPTTRTEQVMVPIASVARALPDDELWAALEALERSGLDATVIASDAPEVRLMTRRSAARLIQERLQELTRKKKLADGAAGFGGRRLGGIQIGRPVAPPAAPMSQAPASPDAPADSPPDGEPGALGEPESAPPDGPDDNGERR